MLAFWSEGCEFESHLWKLEKDVNKTGLTQMVISLIWVKEASGIGGSPVVWEEHPLAMSHIGWSAVVRILSIELCNVL